MLRVTSGINALALQIFATLRCQGRIDPQSTDVPLMVHEVPPPPELKAFTVEPPELDEDATAIASALEPLAVEVALEELVVFVLVPVQLHVHAIASLPLNAKSARQGNVKLFSTLIMASAPFLQQKIPRSALICLKTGSDRRSLAFTAGFDFDLRNRFDLSATLTNL